MLQQRWTGRRVSVRRVLDVRRDGRPQFGDVVGDLLSLDDGTAVIESARGVVQVPVDSIALARLVPASTADELALEAIAASGWRAAESEQLGGWLLRANDGFTGRANSVLALRAPGLHLDEALARTREWYARRRLPLRLAVPVEARRLLDAELGERGWLPERDSHVMTTRLAGQRRTVDVPVEVAITAAPAEDWFARYRDGAGANPSARALLTRHENAVFATVRDAGRVVAIGRATIDAGWLGVGAVEVDPVLRRHGLATAVMRALCDWGVHRGATRSYLQVAVDNPGAVALYEQLGYWVHHDYRYRLDPFGSIADDA